MNHEGQTIMFSGKNKVIHPTYTNPYNYLLKLIKTHDVSFLQLTLDNPAFCMALLHDPDFDVQRCLSHFNQLYIHPHYRIMLQKAAELMSFLQSLRVHDKASLGQLLSLIETHNKELDSIENHHLCQSKTDIRTATLCEKLVKQKIDVLYDTYQCAINNENNADTLEWIELITQLKNCYGLIAMTLQENNLKHVFPTSRRTLR